eukprot:62710-Prymnesium_polylepis.1
MTDPISGAFGPEYEFLNHRQAEHSLTASPAYTEYFEALLETPVYIVRIETGSPRGMGAIVSIKAYHSKAGSWTSLWAGAVQRDAHEAFKEAQRYFTWSPPGLCRIHHKVEKIRVELDTTAETAALPTGTTAVIYEPGPDQFGADHFTYQATDCPGDQFRYSIPARIDVSIIPEQDPPVGTERALTLNLGAQQQVTLTNEHPDDPNGLRVYKYIIIQLPAHTNIYCGGQLVTKASILASPIIELSATVCNEFDSFTFVVNDGHLNSSNAVVNLTMLGCPPDCPPGYEPVGLPSRECQKCSPGFYKSSHGKDS